MLSLIAAALVHYLYGGLRVTTPGARATAQATGHLSVLLGVFVALKAVAYWLDRYGLAVKSGDFKATDNWTGLKYVDANAYLPAKTILFCIAIICALLFFATIWRRTWQLPVIGFGLMVLSAILIGGLYPAIVQKFQVQPNEQAKEAPYIKKNIEATRDAYGIDDSKVQRLLGDEQGRQRRSCATAADTTASMRLLDPNVVSPTFQQKQQVRGYYQFPATLDVDRYKEGRQGAGHRRRSAGDQHRRHPGEELDQRALQVHPRLRHGRRQGHHGRQGRRPGLHRAGPAAQGRPGQVRGPRLLRREDRRSTRSSAARRRSWTTPTTRARRRTRYKGKSGVNLANPVNRAAYAVNFNEPQILYSGAIGEGSRILYNRTPKERVEAVAPWLTIDGDPYPAVVDGRIKWIVDAYTTSNGYPYSSRTTLGDTTADSLTDGQRAVVAQQNQVNYIRNSVKATVDAYNGDGRACTSGTRRTRC